VLTEEGPVLGVFSKNPIFKGDNKMLSGPGCFARFAVIVSALSSCFLVPAGFAQISSSAENHAAFEAALQDQYPNQGGYQRQTYNTHHHDSLTDHLAIEAGGGFNVPAGNTSTWQNVGYSLNLGGGWMFNDRIGVLAEYSFNGANIPQNTLTNIGEPDGNVHVWSLTLDPIIYYKTSGHIGGYVTGGGGFYRKLTTFTQPVYAGDYCDYFYGCYPVYENETLSHFSSNQGGVNIGTGVTFKPNPDGKLKLYAEARYVWVDSPKNSASGIGTGTLGMVPVTFGFRW
jgi:Outer membrane protein beta-barrel domain